MPNAGKKPEARIERLEVRAYTVPTDRPESDGTLEWDSTTLVPVRAYAGGKQGLGYSYTDASAGGVVLRVLRDRLVGRDAFDLPGAWTAMRNAIRNLGQTGIASMAVAAVDAALWDLKAKLLDIPLIKLLGSARESIPVYGSGGFTSYTVQELQEQLGGWAAQGIGMVKMKIGRDPGADPERVKAARQAIGPGVRLFVDANGAYSRKQALAMAQIFQTQAVSWFEQPVYHYDFEGLRLLRDNLPPGMDLSTGEYGFDVSDFYRILQAGATDVLQADATRCGVTGFLLAASLCEAYHLPLSSHCAPALHLPLCCSAPRAIHLEYFHDHVRLEHLLFEGIQEPQQGLLRPDLSRPGLGLELKEQDAEKYAVPLS